MSGKRRLVYVCTQCGEDTPRWVGQCPSCGEWNTLQEFRVGNGSRQGEAPRQRGGFAGAAGSCRPQSLAEIGTTPVKRFSAGTDELDRVLGGGFVPGAVVLLGGDPGVGKSTLLLQTLGHLARRLAVLYVTGEESPEQVALRARRLGVADSGVVLLAETLVERIIEHAADARPGIVVVDSIQTLWSESIESSPGSVSQVRECAAQLTRFAKETATTVVLVGHVTKEGTLAGPRVLEHMVDTVLYFEGETGGRIRLIRAVKNRYGAVNELGVFAMTDQGLRPVDNPSAIFLSRPQNAAPGSIVTATLKGTRPLLVEVQSLVDQSPLANPRRLTQGLDSGRVAMLLAVLHRHAGVALADQDVYVNVVGGVRITETAGDLAVTLSALSSFRNRSLDRALVVFGEIGLAGEIRPVPGGEQRLLEAARQGFAHAIVPHGNVPRGGVHGLAVHTVRRLDEAIGIAFDLTAQPAPGCVAQA